MNDQFATSYKVSIPSLVADKGTESSFFIIGFLTPLVFLSSEFVSSKGFYSSQSAV